MDLNEVSSTFEGTVTIYNGQTVGEEYRIYEQNITIPANSNPHTHTITFSGGNGTLEFTAGEQYTILISQTSGGSLSWNFDNSDPYSGGQLYGNGEFMSIVDNAFELYTTSTVSSADYVLVSTGRDLEFDKSIIHSGGVGVMSNQGEAEIEDHSVITAAGTFVKATQVEIDFESQVAETILQPADPVLPEFRYNPYSVGGINNNLIVPFGETLILTESIYEEIDVGNNATIIFSGQSDVYIRELDLEDGVTVIFDQCTNVMIKSCMELGRNNVFNPSEMDVAVFAEGEISIEKMSTVYGILYSKDELEVGESHSFANSTQMHGLFIGREVQANEHGEYWAMNFEPICPPMEEETTSVTAEAEAVQWVQVPTLGSAEEEIPLREPGTITFAAEVAAYSLYPNPASNEITLSFQGHLGKATQIRIHNMQGQLMSQQNHLSLDQSDVTFELNQFVGGIYSVIVSVEGEEPVVKKFVVER